MGTGTPVDLRSTGRKRARSILLKAVEQELVAFACNQCGWTPIGKLSRSNNLDVNHINKNLEDVDLANLEFLCRKCHKEKDSQTERGVSVIDDEFGYELGR